MGDRQFPGNWLIGQDFDPNEHLMNLKGRDYLNVQNRLLWFIRDQRALIVAGLATTSYVIRTELVELDRETGWAHFRTYVRDVLGNEVTMYGSESMKDFTDYAEKASTKSLGRALLALGYGTAFAPEIDEGVRVVDTPTERMGETRRQTNSSQQLQQSSVAQPTARPTEAAGATDTGASEKQLAAIAHLCEFLGRQVPEVRGTKHAQELIKQLNQEAQRRRAS